MRIDQQSTHRQVVIKGYPMETSLLGGEAGLRCGEIMALEWTDVDLSKRQLSVRRSEWKGHVTAPKGSRGRYVPLTTRLADAHSFCSHLAMRGAPACAIQALAGHQDLVTTQRYMHPAQQRSTTRSDCWTWDAWQPAWHSLTRLAKRQISWEVWLRGLATI